MTPAEMLKRALARTQSHTPQPITDEFAKAIARKLESRGIAKVPGLPEEEESWHDRVLEFLREQPDLEERAAKRQAEQEQGAATEPQTTAGILRKTIAADIPLNGPAVIRAAGGNPYDGRHSVASLIEAEIRRSGSPPLSSFSDDDVMRGRSE